MSTPEKRKPAAAAPEPETPAEAANLALAPEQPDTEPVARAYRVTGPHIVLGHKPGAQFTAVIPAGQEALLIESGHIKRSNPED